MKTFRLLFTRRTILAATLALAAAGGAQAEAYPSKPIKLLVPYAAGGTTDQMARLLALQLTQILGQPLVIENRPGAAGALAVEQAARSAPDGYTIVFGNSAPNAILPATRKLNYDPIKDLAPISIVARVPVIWAVPASLPVSNMKEFIDYAKARPGQLNFGSTGLGSSSQLAAEQMAAIAGIKMVHVPFNGGAPAMLAFRRGDLHGMFVTGVDGSVHEKAGAIKYLGIGTPARVPMAPDLPAIAETIPGFTGGLWFGLLAPAGTPPEILNKLQQATAQAVKNPATVKTFADLIIVAESSTQAEMAATIQAELAHWTRLLKELNIKVQ